MTRGEFIFGAMAAVGLSGCRWPGGPSDRSYGVAVLGDTHYDAEPESLYHSHYDESNRYAKVQHDEFRRNGEMWRTRCGRMLQASGRLAKCEPTDFVLQLGDLIQGDCDDVPTHQKMMADAIALMRGAYPEGLPFLTVLGNHDVRGKGARKAYLDFAEPYMTRELGLAAPARYPVFAWRKGPDLWVFCDFEMRDLNPLLDALVEVPRYTFLVTHGPFIPEEDSQPRWRLAGQPHHDALLPKLYELLSRRHAIILSGHSHQTVFARCRNAFGGFAELTFNSVWSSEDLATIAPEAESAADYGKYTESFGDAKRSAAFESGAKLFRPDLVDYFFSKAAGHSRLDISDAGVTARFYGGAALEPTRTFRLSHF